MVVLIILGCGMAVLVSAVVGLLRQGKGSLPQSRVPHWGYGPRGLYSSDWYRSPWSIGERVDRAIEEGRSAQQHFSPHRGKRNR